MMKTLWIVFAVFMLASCTKNLKEIKSAAVADYLMTKEWIYTHKLSHLKNSGSVITRPPGIELLVLGLEMPEAGGIAFKKHCVYYLVPYKDKGGELKITETKSLEPCPETASGKPWLRLNDLRDFAIEFNHYRLVLSFEQQKKKRIIEIPLPNLEDGLIHEKYSPLKEKRLYDGLKLLRLSDDSFDYASNRYLGKLADRFGQGDAIRCHRVNKNCETIGENRCDDCRYGWYEVVDYQCPQGGSKFCGQNHCGEKNEPACPRGIKVIDLEDNGICQNDLEPVINADKVLICQ